VGGTDHGPSAFTWVRTTGHWRALGVRIGAGACHLGAKQTILITSARIAPVVASTFAFPANLDCIFTVHTCGLEVWISANASHLGTRKTIFIAFASVAPVVFGTFAFPANLDCIFTVHAGLGVCIRTAVAGASVAPVVAGTFA